LGYRQRGSAATNSRTVAIPDLLGEVANPDPVAGGRRFAAAKSGRIRPLRRLDSVGIRALQEVKSGGSAALVAIRAPNGTNRKHLFKTMPSKEGPITAACYLCNTHSKTDNAPCPETVPLLRV
jgi:hypothetical protein